MFKRPTLAALAFWTSPALATFVQGAANNTGAGSATSLTLTFGSPIGAGHCIWGYVSALQFGDGLSFSGSLSGTSITILDNISDGTFGEDTASFILGNISGSPTTLTLGWGGSTLTVAAVAVEESGCLAASNPVDVHTGSVVSISSSSIGTNGISLSVSATVANDILVGASMNDGGTTAPSAGTSPNSFTLRTTSTIDGNLPMVTEDGVTQASSGTAVVTFGTTVIGQYGTFAIAIKPSAGGASVKHPSFLDLLGVGN